MDETRHVRGAGLRRFLHISGLVAALALAPGAWATPNGAAGPPPVQKRSSSGLDPGNWMDWLLESFETAWTAAGCWTEPGVSACTDTPPSVEDQDGETCDPTTTEAGCRIDPNG